jgi:hypothetical protein
MGYCLVDYGATSHGVQDRTRPGMADGSYHDMDSESQDTDRPALLFDGPTTGIGIASSCPQIVWVYHDTMPCLEGVRDLTSGQQSVSASNMTHLPYLRRKLASWCCMPVCSCFAGYIHVQYCIAMPCHAMPVR